jgi:hypothetical protein
LPGDRSAAFQATEAPECGRPPILFAMPDVLRDEVVAKRKIVYLRHVGKDRQVWRVKTRGCTIS